MANALHMLGVNFIMGGSNDSEALHRDPKRMIAALTGRELINERIHGSVAAALIAVQRGASIVRAHDVAATRDALAVWQAVSAATPVKMTKAVSKTSLWGDDE